MSVLTAPASVGSDDAPTVRGARLTGVGVTLVGLVLVTAQSQLHHHYDAGAAKGWRELPSYAIAGVLGYVLAFLLGWWRPARSATPRRSAAVAGLTLALLGLPLDVICFWNPMPLTVAASAVLLVRWGRAQGGAGAEVLERVVLGLSAVVVAAQLITLVARLVASM